MKSSALTRWAGLIALFLTVLTPQAKAAALSVGSKAPPLEVADWVQGDPVKEFSKGTSYLVEFWATWCGPCRVSIPHLNEIHQKFKDKGLVVIGQDVWEQDTSLVKPFIKKMGDKMTYRVALDKVVEGEDAGRMAAGWMQAAGQGGIPTAFLVDGKSQIAWIGHPMELKDETIEEVIAGKFDLSKAIAAQKKREQADGLWRDYSKAVRADEWKEAEGVLDKLEALLAGDPQASLTQARVRLYLDRGEIDRAYALAEKAGAEMKSNPMGQNGLVWDMITREGVRPKDLAVLEKIISQADAATKSENSEILDTYARVLFIKGEKERAIAMEAKAVQFAEEGRKATFTKVLEQYRAGKVPPDARLRALRESVQKALNKKDYPTALRILEEREKEASDTDRLPLQKQKLDVLYSMQKLPAAFALAKSISEAHSDNAMLQNDLSWEILTRNGLQERDLELAIAIARRANVAAKEVEPEILDTLARALFMKGQTEEAIKIQAKAVELAKEGRKKQFQATLDDYKAGKLAKVY